MKDKLYLGDSVYAQNDGFGIVLTIEDGIRVINEIYLEPSVYQALVDYVARYLQETLNQNP